MHSYTYPFEYDIPPMIFILTLQFKCFFFIYFHVVHTHNLQLYLHQQTNILTTHPFTFHLFLYFLIFSFSSYKRIESPFSNLCNRRFFNSLFLLPSQVIKAMRQTILIVCLTAHTPTLSPPFFSPFIVKFFLL
jgi:hypothetical protein